MQANYMKKQEFQYKDNSKNISRVRTIPTAVDGINITNMAFIQTQNMRTGTNANVNAITQKDSVEVTFLLRLITLRSQLSFLQPLIE